MRIIPLFLVALMAISFSACAMPDFGKDAAKMMQFDGKDRFDQPYCDSSGETDQCGKQCDCNICFDRCFDKCTLFEYCENCHKYHYCDGYCDSCGEKCNWGEYCNHCGYNHAGYVDGYCDKCGRRCNAYEQCDNCGHSHLYDGCCDDCRIRCYFDLCCMTLCDQHCDNYPCECKDGQAGWKSAMKDGQMNKDRRMIKGDGSDATVTMEKQVYMEQARSGYGADSAPA
jgi:hypothetical protein